MFNMADAASVMLIITTKIIIIIMIDLTDECKYINE